MKSSLQAEYIGSRYNLLEIYLYRDDSGADIYVDAVHIGKRPTTNDENGTKLDSTFFFPDNFYQFNTLQHLNTF